jgi:hypothetical protein
MTDQKHQTLKKSFKPLYEIGLRIEIQKITKTITQMHLNLSFILIHP